MPDGVRPVGFVLGLAAIIAAGQHWVIAIPDFPDDSYWIFLALPLMALLETVTATEIPGILAFIIRSMTLQLAVALLFAATIPWWKQEHSRVRRAA